MKYLIFLFLLISLPVQAYTITNADRQIEKQMLELNDKLPLKMNNTLTLKNLFVSIEHKHIFYMAVVDMSAEQIFSMKNNPSIMENRVNSICSNSNFKHDTMDVFNNNWTLVYVYYTIDNEVIKTIHINKADCLRREKNEKLLIKN